MSQPISLPPNTDNDSHNGSFNPASYTRHMLGSPLSWRAGSFGGRYAMDFKPTSIENDSSAIFNPLNLCEDQVCRDFTCCGLQLGDLHALLEHFEEVHVVVLDQQQPIIPPSYFPPSYTQAGPFDPDDMELDSPSSYAPSPSPPDTPVSTPLTAYPSHSFARTYPHSTPASACPSPPPPHYPVSAFDTTTVLPSRARSALGMGVSAFPTARPLRPTVSLDGNPAAFNAYAGYSDYSALMPGTAPSPPASDDTHPATPTEPGSPYAGGVPPALLFSAATTPATTPSTSRLSSPVRSSPSNAGTTPSASRASTTLSRPSSSLLLSKPFRCPKPHCNKSYKQANGLKYHITHGSCTLTPPPPHSSNPALDAVHALLAGRAVGDVSPEELRAAEREAERRVRPFACGVGECQRRYKNMNGLRYHYQHSGEHGAVGLALLASGQHECLARGRYQAPVQEQVVEQQVQVQQQWDVQTTTMQYVQVQSPVKYEQGELATALGVPGMY